MFTGLVLGLGEIIQVSSSGSEARLCIAPKFPLHNLVKGESIAVNGACLSVETFTSSSFTVYASQETMRLTTLNSLSKGSLVNLERALALGDRLGGHMVSGHVDAVACIEKISPAGDSKQVALSFPEKFAKQVIAKGSVTLEGISLTINSCQGNVFEVNIIPETQKSTTVQFWQQGQKLNFETDIIGKYVEKMLTGYMPQNLAPESKITLDFLSKNGF